MNFVVTEHERINISDYRSLENKQISNVDKHKLHQIEAKCGKSIFRWDYNYLTCQQWVGVVSTPQITIEILPKIYNTDNYEQIRNILIYMLQVAYDVPIRNNINARVSNGRDGFFEILARIFLNELDFQIKAGIHKEYSKKTKNLPVVKGKIDFSQQFNKNLFVANRFVCSYTTLSGDNIINLAFKNALIIIASLVRTESNRILNRRLLSYFINIDGDIKLNQLENISYNRNTFRFKKAVDLSKLFLNSSTIALKNGKIDLGLMLFDMNNLYEKFIAQSYKRAKIDSKYHPIHRYLLEDINTEELKIRLQPDLLIKTEHDTILVDTKWKVNSNRKNIPNEQDIYQMNAYLSGFPEVNKIILLYPKTPANDKMVGEYNIANSPNMSKLYVRTINLLKVTNLNEFNTELLNSLI